MNTTSFLISSFKPYKSQTIFSCKRKATLILSLLKQIHKNPTFLTMSSSDAILSDIYSICSPYHLRTNWVTMIGNYRHQKNLSWDKPISRALLLDILAYCDGYPSWENMQHNLSNLSKDIKTYVLKYDPMLNHTLLGGCSAQVFWDNKDKENNGVHLYNPAKKFNQLKIGYAWGYAGSSVNEFSRALLYSIDQGMTDYTSVLTEEFLCYFAQNKPEILITEFEICQFITHYKLHNDITLKRELDNLYDSPM